MHPLAYDDGELFVARLTDRGDPVGSDWKEVFGINFVGSTPTAGPLPENWRFEAGKWDVTDAGLRGRTERGRLLAITPLLLPPETAGQVTISLRMRHLRGSGKAQKIILQAWRQNEATHAAVVLSPGKGTIALVQTEEGEILHRESRPTKLQIGKRVRLTVLYDHLGFQVFLNRKLILEAPDRFSTAPVGAVAIQGQNLDVEVERLRVSAQETGVEAAGVPSADL
jgi:hypothetical protein